MQERDRRIRLAKKRQRHELKKKRGRRQKQIKARELRRRGMFRGEGY